MMSSTLLAPALHGEEAVSVAGLAVNVFESYDAAVETICRRMRAGRKTFCLAVNPEKIERAIDEPPLRRVLENADVRICDGVGVALAAWVLHGRRLRRCTGVDLFLNLTRAAEREGWSVYLLGASPASNAAACRALSLARPGLRIAGARSGFFENSAEVIAEINASGADALFVGMGSPRQEFWIWEHLGELRPLLAMGVGGAFDMLSGNVKRAPAIFRKTGTEWLFRLAAQPTRLRRQLALPRFALDVLRGRYGRGSAWAEPRP